LVKLGLLFGTVPKLKGDKEHYFSTNTAVPNVMAISPGAYGLPQLKAARGYRIYDDDPDYRFVFEYPTSWVGRTNTLRDGVYFSDFNVSALISPPFKPTVLLRSPLSG
jgi:hypothetical protein